MKIPKPSDQDKHWTYWQRYKAFFNVSVFRYLVTFFAIVPVLAGLFPALAIKLSLNISMPFTWELLWLSAFFFVVAYCIYLAACPRFIKKYASYKAYQEEGHSPRWLTTLVYDYLLEKQNSKRLLRNLKTKKIIIESAAIPEETNYTILPSVRIEEKRTVLKFIEDGKVHSLSMPVLDAGGKLDAYSTALAEKEIFWDIFNSYASSKKNTRMIISLLIIISGALFGYVLFENIRSGFEYLFSRFIYCWLLSFSY